MDGLLDRLIEEGGFAVTMKPFGDPQTTYHIPAGSVVGVTKIHPGLITFRQVDIVYIHEDEKTMATAHVCEYDLHWCDMERV